MAIVWTLIIIAAVFIAFSFAWRWASRNKSLPCPTSLAWFLESPTTQRLNGTLVTLDRLKLKPGETILEIGPGPGRLLIPAAQRILPGGEAYGIELQPGMVERLTARAKQANVSNMTIILGDATEPYVPDATFDLVFLCTVLGEVPDRAAVLTRSYNALKPGGRLCIAELIGDPHYQALSTVKRLAEEAGFCFVSIEGRWWSYTATFTKP